MVTVTKLHNESNLLDFCIRMSKWKSTISPLNCNYKRHVKHYIPPMESVPPTENELIFWFVGSSSIFILFVLITIIDLIIWDICICWDSCLATCLAYSELFEEDNIDIKEQIINNFHWNFISEWSLLYVRSAPHDFVTL